MKKKVIILAGLCTLGLCAWTSQVVNPLTSSTITMEYNVPSGYEIIVLQGSLMLSVGPNTIVAGASEDAVYIGFNQIFGNVNITIYNGMGSIVYRNVIDTNMQREYFIPFSGYANGTYTLELDNTTGYADGIFERD